MKIMISGTAEFVSFLQNMHQTGGLPRIKRELEKCDLLVLDELGFIPFHKDGIELLFHLISECCER
jgi:DNA replication protein DnaC